MGNFYMHMVSVLCVFVNEFLVHVSCEKALHICCSHILFFLPSCITPWPFKFIFVLNLLSQKSHLNGFSSLCTSICFLRYPFVLKSCSCTTEVMLQMWQCNTFFVQLLVTMSLILSTQINQPHSQYQYFLDPGHSLCQSLLLCQSCQN